MDELDIYKAIDNAVKLKKQEQAKYLSENVLSIAAGQGNKDANRKVQKIIKEITRELQKEQMKETLKNSTGKLVSSKLLTKEELKQLTGAKK